MQGKKNVIILWKKIKDNFKFSKVLTSFFIDKDYETKINQYDNNVFETPYHSLENFYVRPETFKRIIIKEFGIYTIEEDYSKVVHDYNEKLSEYRRLLAGLNAFIICFNKLEVSINIDKFKISDFVDIDIRKLEIKKEMNFESLKIYYLEKLQNEVRQNKNHAKENLEKFLNVIGVVESMYQQELDNVIQNLDNLSHGKMELHFLKKIIENLKLLNGKKEYFSCKRDSVNLDINSKNILSNLSQHAFTPEDLKEFLETKQFEDNIKVRVAN